MGRHHSSTCSLLLLVVLGACGADGMDEIVFGEEPTGINDSSLGVAVYGTARDDLWAPVPGGANGGTVDGPNHVLHYTGSGVASMPLPSAILALPGGHAAAYAAGNRGEFWMAGATGGATGGNMVLVKMNADGTSTDYSALLPAVADINSMTMLSDHGALLLAYGGPMVRIENDTAEIIPDAPMGTFATPAALHDRDIYAATAPQNAPSEWIRFDGTTWSTVSLPGTRGPIGFSFASANDGWAMGTNFGRNPDNMYPLYRFDGAWTTQVAVINGSNNWTPIGVLATGPGTCAVLGVTPQTDTYSLVYRTRTATSVSDNDNTYATQSVSTPIDLVKELDDGSFLMASGRDARMMNTRVFVGNRADLK